MVDIPALINLAKIHFSDSAMWEGTLWWCKIHLLDQRFGLFWQILCCKHSKTWRQNAWVAHFGRTSSYRI